MRIKHSIAHSVRMIFELTSTSSIFRALFPFPLVLRPFKDCPEPLNDSNSPPTVVGTALFPSEDPGREEPGVDELTSIFSLLAIVSTGGGGARFGST